MAKPSKPQWDKIEWSEEIQQRMYRDWATKFTSLQHYGTAKKYFTKSLALKDDDPVSLYYRSIDNCELADAEGALKDSLLALKVKDDNLLVNMQVVRSLYHMNSFEDCKVECDDKSRKFVGNRKLPFQWLLDVLEQNFMDSLGDYLGPFFLKNQKYLEKVVAHYNKLKNVDKRPLWKILKEQEKCDIVSILEEEEELLHPREIARRNLCFRVFRQVYFHKLWIDTEFLRRLKKNKTLCWPPAKRSTTLMTGVVSVNYDIVINFLKMLEARSPMYTEIYKICPNPKLGARMKEDYLFRTQYQTRRDMFIILDKVKDLRKKGDIEKMAKFVEHAMGDYVILKTRRVMPRKFEFINEVYNITALGYLDKCYVPSNILDVSMDDRLNVLMSVPIEKDKDKFVSFIFGDKSTYQEPDATDYGYMAYKKYIDRLEKRLYFAQYPIEKCYLLHEIARNHLKQSKFDESLSVAKKSIEEAKLCQNYAWIFLANLMVSQINVSTKTLERLNESLVQSKKIVDKLKSPKLEYFIDTCLKMNEMMIEKRKKSSMEVSSAAINK